MDEYRISERCSIHGILDTCKATALVVYSHY
jgi:hypothetical protein